MNTQLTLRLILIGVTVIVGCNSAENNAARKKQSPNEVENNSTKVDSNAPSASQKANKPVPTDEPITSTDKLALLVGINDYLAEEMVDLDGCVNDVEDMKNLLIGTFDFPAQNVKVLTDAQATREGIIATFRSHLVDNATSDSIVVFHYSGHGSQIKDISGDETDGWDETIVSHDSRTKGVFDITDDEFNGLFGELSGKTKNITFIMDSCHSGSGTRGGGKSRKANRDTRTPPKNDAISGNASPESEGFKNDNYVLISGCRSHEESKEHVDSKGQSRGVMTYFLTREIRSAVKTGGGVTYRDVMDQVKAKVTAIHSSQHPQMEGANLDNFVFEDKTSVAQPYVLAQPERDNEVQLNGGKVVGFTEGSLFDVYKPGTKKFDDPQQRIAQIELTSVDAYISTAKIIDGGPIESSSRAVERQHSYKQTRFPVYVDLAGQSTDDSVKGSEVLQSIRQQLAEGNAYKNNFKLVDEQLKGRIVVSERSDGKIHIAGNGSAIENPAVPVGDADAVKRVLAQTKHWAQWFNVLDLDNPGSDLAVDFKIEPVGEPRTINELGRYFLSDDKIRLVVRNNSKKKLYFAIVDVCSDGTITPIHPPSGDAEFIGPGDTWSDETVRLYVNPEQVESIDHMKLLAFDKQINVSILDMDAVPRGNNDGCAPLAQAMLKTTRGATAVVQRNSWMTTSKVLRVLPRDPKLD